MLAGLLLLAVGAAAFNNSSPGVLESNRTVVPVPSSSGSALEVADQGGGHEGVEGRGMHKLKKAFKKWMPYLMVPTMMALGYAPFVLSSLKMMVMNAVMINMMAFNAAIFLTLRNMAFGPRLGQHIRYYNFGYTNRKKHHHHHHHHH